MSDYPIVCADCKGHVWISDAVTHNNMPYCKTCASKDDSADDKYIILKNGKLLNHLFEDGVDRMFQSYSLHDCYKYDCFLCAENVADELGAKAIQIKDIKYLFPDHYEDYEIYKEE